MFEPVDRNSTARTIRQAAENSSASHSLEVIAGNPRCGLVIVCDHACNVIPAEYDNLGLPPGELERHIAYDIGVEGVTRGLARRLGAPAVLARFSRLVIDPNRGLDDPTLIMRLSDGAVVPGNAFIDADERDRRIARFYRPYDEAVGALIAGSVAAGPLPAVLSIHSFTPVWRGVPRPWHIGVLWKRDDRFAAPLLGALAQDPQLVVGDNEPYSGGLAGDTMDRHATAKGLPDALIEIRQDLIAGTQGVNEWVERLAGLLPGVLAQPGVHRPLAASSHGNGDRRR
jgi:predicted N-formylglutamate amidohydrolase